MNWICRHLIGRNIFSCKTLLSLVHRRRNLQPRKVDLTLGVDIGFVFSWDWTCESCYLLFGLLLELAHSEAVIQRSKIARQMSIDLFFVDFRSGKAWFPKFESRVVLPWVCLLIGVVALQFFGSYSRGWIVGPILCIRLVVESNILRWWRLGV
jgi:hypothetical protein